LLAGLTLGLAWGAKLSALILLPGFGLALLWHVWRRGAVAAPLLTGFMTILCTSALVLWALYRFEAAAWIPMPTHWDNLQRLWQHQASGQRAFFLGQLSDEGWWYYFPVLFVIKTPLPLLILLVVAIVAAWRTRTRPLVWPPVTIIFPTLYFAVSIASKINIGYRHILPVVPFAAIVAASALRPPRRGRSLVIGHWSLVIGHCLIVSLFIVSLLIAPYYLAYFNALVGGPDQGYRYAVDSNLDWGQDLKRLKVYLDERGIDHIKLSYFGMARPEQYNIEYTPLLSQDFMNPEPGVYAISASNLWLLEDPDIFDWFRRRQPTAKIGYSIFIYDITDRLEGEWAAVCYAPIPALEAEQIRDALGNSDLRLVYFDCRSSWVWPAGAAPGWYVIPDDTDGPTVVSAYNDETQIIFHGRRTSKRLGLTVYRGEGVGARLPRPYSQTQFADVARFLGYEVEQGDTLTLRTYWEVLDRPDLPLSVMAHLVDDQGRPAGVADGLGFPVENWQKGDIFAQTHPFTLPPPHSHTPTPPYFFHVGLYRLDTMERLPPAGSAADHLTLGPIEVRDDGR
jgi:hypothetical protein